MHIEYLSCQCGSLEHTIQFMFDKENNEIYVQSCVYNYQSFWKRLFAGIKFIFTRTNSCKFDCTILKEEDINKFKKLLNDFQQ